VISTKPEWGGGFSLTKEKGKNAALGKRLGKKKRGSSKKNPGAERRAVESANVAPLRSLMTGLRKGVNRRKACWKKC